MRGEQSQLATLPDGLLSCEQALWSGKEQRKGKSEQKIKGENARRDWGGAGKEDRPLLFSSVRSRAR